VGRPWVWIALELDTGMVAYTSSMEQSETTTMGKRRWPRLEGRRPPAGSARLD
jgi:hypothetical protein